MTFNRDELLLLKFAVEGIIRDYRKTIDNMKREGENHPLRGMRETMEGTMLEYMELLEKIDG